MKLGLTPIDDLYVIEPKVIKDERGFFTEFYNEDNFEKLNLNYIFIQDNHSRSKYGVLRGLHFQGGHIYGQAKLVRCARGKVWDVAVDLRPYSKTFGRWFGEYLSDENFKMLMIPSGFAHGFVALSDEIDLVYKCDQLYNKDAENGIDWNDSDIGIEWPIQKGDIITSERDKNNKSFEQYCKGIKK